MGKLANYDKWQFAGAEGYPVHAHNTPDGWVSTGISFEDYTRMNIRVKRSSNERRLPTPDWSLNDVMLRGLIVAFIEERAGFRKPWPQRNLKLRLQLAQGHIITKQLPAKNETLTKLCKTYVAVKTYGVARDKTDDEVRALYMTTFDATTPPLFIEHVRGAIETKRLRELEVEIEGIDTYLRTHQTGGADIVAGIVYLYYRAGLDSVGVANELRIKPPHVRTTLFRLHETWDKHHGKKAVAKPAIDEAVPVAGFVTKSMFE